MNYRPGIRIGVATAVLAMAGSALFAADAARIRVAIPAILNAYSDPTPATAGEMFTRIFGVQLRERERDCATLELVSQKRCDAIMSELTSPLRDNQPDKLLGEFRRFQPVDRVVYCALTKDNKVDVRILSDSGIVKTNMDALAVLQDQIQAAMRFIADNLPISDRDRKVLTEVRIPDSQQYLAVYGSQCYPPAEIWAHRPSKPYAPYCGVRVSSLLERWNMTVENHWFSLAVVRAASEFYLAYAQPVEGEYRTTDTFLQQGWVTMTKFVFKDILGTRDEAEIYPLMRLAPSVFERDAIALAKLALSIEGALLDDGNDAVPALLDDAPAKKDVPRERRLGGVRLLGILDLPASTNLLTSALNDHEADVREAAAFGAGWLRARAGVPLLQPLLKDEDPRVAFAAAAGLRKMGAPPPNLLEMAKPFATDKSRLAREAIAVLAELGGKAEVPLLQKLAAERTPQRAAVVAGLLRLNAATDRQKLDWLSDCDEAVIQAVLASSPDLAEDNARRNRLETLANDPLMPIANRARYLLARSPPKDPWQLMAQELKIEHPYIREQTLDQLAADRGPQATRMLQDACDNLDPHVRAKAMEILARRDPESARPRVERALNDSHLWVRFHAATLAALVATPDMIPALKRAIEEADHSSTRLYLQEALAKVGGGPAPKQPEAARSIKTDRNLAWCTSPGLYADESPFDAYYCMDTRRVDNMRRAHDAGKILYARCMPLRAPAKLIMDRAERDAFIPRLDQELSDEVMEMLDGVIYGEETMDYLIDALWDDGWQLFCRDAKLDPVKIAGKIDNLNTFERRAWNDWAGRINGQGFNLLAEFTRLRYGKLRPGLQVGSFQFGGPKSDFSGVYDYKGDNRLCAYDLVRGSKTICPDRPVLWLSLGIGGYEMNPVYNTQPVPTGPLFDTYDRSWSDSLTAWLAGAENGWFSTWIFLSPLREFHSMGGLRGKQVWVEDIGPDSPILSEAIDYSQKHASKYKEPVVMPNAPSAALSFDMSDDQKEVTLEDPEEKQAAGQKAVDASLAKRKEEMTVGFIYYQQYVYDCARVFASLPRQEYRSPALVNREGVDVWTRPESDYPRVPAHALLNRYDYLYSLNQAPELDLSGYRLFITHNTSLLRDETIRTITKWLREQPGLLVVHRNLPAENDAELSTVEDHDGRLQEDWPWEKDLRVVAGGPQPKRGPSMDVVLDGRTIKLKSGYVRSHFELTGPNATGLATVDGRTVLALWRNPGVFKGMVLFDGMEYTSNEYLDALRATLNALYRDKQVGMRVEGPALIETLSTSNITAAAATRYYNPAKEAVVVPGLSAMGFFENPIVGRLIGCTSDLTIRNYIGRFLAASESLVAVSEKPFTEARLDGDNLVLKAPGVVRVGGSVTVTALDGKALPVLTPPADGPGTSDYRENGFARWRFKSGQEGVFVLRGVTYFRSREAVVVRPAPRLSPATTAKPEAEGAKDLQAMRLAQAEKEKARKAGPVEEMTLDLGGGVKMAFVRIKAIGGWAGKYEVTQQEFKRFQPARESLGQGGEFDANRLPVVNVTYDDAAAFAAWVNQSPDARIPQGLCARLPDGNEWLALAQCGDHRTYPWGNSWPPEYGNYFDTNTFGATNLVGTYRDGYIASCPVENSGRNDWGLYGVGGNVWEWTSELTPAESEWRIRRGAAWLWGLWGKQGYDYDLRCVHRSYAFPSLRDLTTGFRLVLAPAR